MQAAASTSGDHASVLGTPGERPRLAGLLRAVWPLAIALAVGGYLLRAAVPAPALGRTTAGFLFLVLAVLLAAALNRTRERLTAFLKGARGEERVARELAFLPRGYTVFHGLNIPRSDRAAGGDCDHVVVGGTGVFVVETKNWTDPVTLQDGRVLYDGRVPDRSPLDQVRAAAGALRGYLRQVPAPGLDVQPVLCFAADTLKDGTAGTGGVIVCNARDLHTVILDPSGARLGREGAAAVSERLAGLLPDSPA